MKKISFSTGGSTAAAIVWLLFICVFVFGWIANIVKLVGISGEIGGMFIVRVIGIFVAPLGSILGYL